MEAEIQRDYGVRLRQLAMSRSKIDRPNRNLTIFHTYLRQGIGFIRGFRAPIFPTLRGADSPTTRLYLARFSSLGISDTGHAYI